MRAVAGWTLRTRLTAALVLLLASVSLVIGLVSVLALQRFMTDQVDRQLLTAVQRSRDIGDRRLPPGSRTAPGARAEDQLPPGTAPGGLFARISGGTVAEASTLDERGRVTALPPAARTVIARVPADGAIRTADLQASLGAYRIVAERDRAGDVFVTGVPLSTVSETVARLITVIVAVALLGLVVCALLGAAIVRASLRPMQRMAATARRVAELPLDRGEVALAERVPAQDGDPRTEVGQMGAALNRMLDHVATALDVRQASESRMRRFVSDASHELRTPLASIRGYAELTRRSGEDLPPVSANAMRRVESEAVRMTGLVEDLLLLARLDERRSLARHPVDLTELVIDAVGDAHAASTEHRWQLDLPDEPVTVTGDRDRLHQVVANLLANARTHTPAGTVVEVGLERGPAGVAVLRVVDDGPGIPADLVPEVFERFARGDSSRTRVPGRPVAGGSTGLGLAIVASVVEAHGGRVDVRSRPGHTEFTVLLPAVAGTGHPALQDPADIAPDAQPAGSASSATSRRNSGCPAATGTPSSSSA